MRCGTGWSTRRIAIAAEPQMCAAVALAARATFASAAATTAAGARADSAIANTPVVDERAGWHYPRGWR
jgi:hypothetical protein